jgi:hypothetical protein
MRPRRILAVLATVLLSACADDGAAVAANGSDPVVKGGDDRFGDYDPERNIWVVERGKMQVLKFSNDGKRLLMQGA